MSYYAANELSKIGFKKLGSDVKISKMASIYDPALIEIGDRSRIDDFSILSGKINIGRNVHIAPNCLIAGGEKGITFEDFSGLAYHVLVFTQSDDYTGETLTNPTIPSQYKNEYKAKIILKKHAIIGAGSIIMPGVTINEGCSVGAMSVVRKTTESWSIYLGNPAKKIKNRKKDILELEKMYLEEISKK